MSPTPILFMSDGLTAGTGLARITRDLAERVHKYLPDKFRVGSYGYGGPFSRALGFPMYEMKMENWVCFNLPEVWKDFAGDEHGILFVVWDASRLLWLSRPENCEDPRLRAFLESKPYELWTYSPLDAHGVDGRLTMILKHTLEGFDRVLAYSPWACDVLKKTLDESHYTDLEWRSHGVDTSVFYPRNCQAARHGFGEKLGARTFRGKYVSIPDDAYLVGIIATNQARKDWATGINVIAEIAKAKAPRPVWAWLHIDRLENAWSLPILVQWDFKIHERCVVTTVDYSDEQLAWAYSACDITLGIGNGEGWGLPLAESLACGTPVIHGNYAGGADFVPKEMLVEPAMDRIDGVYSLIRKVYRVEDWVRVSLAAMELKSNQSLLPEWCDWNGPILWDSWQQWFLKGIDDTKVQPETALAQDQRP